jgi:hypothetical protein
MSGPSYQGNGSSTLQAPSCDTSHRESTISDPVDWSSRGLPSLSSMKIDDLLPDPSSLHAPGDMEAIAKRHFEEGREGTDSSGGQIWELRWQWSRLQNWSKWLNGSKLDEGLRQQAQTLIDDSLQDCRNYATAILEQGNSGNAMGTLFVQLRWTTKIHNQTRQLMDLVGLKPQEARAH